MADTSPGRRQSRSAAREGVFVEWFPFGVAPFFILLVTLAAGGWLWFNPVPRSDADLRMWIFAMQHLDAYRQGMPAFEASHPGKTVDLQLVHNTAVTSRLRAAFMANLNVPDVVEVEVSSSGSFFRGPVEQVGFRDLRPFLEQSGLMDRIVASRLATYTNRGRIFGLPHDVHPVMLAYRKDLFDELGLRAEDLDTWDKFIAAGRRVTQAGRRYMMQLSDTDASSLEVFLFQRGGDYFDAQGKLIMDDDTALRTLLWFVPVVAGEHRIADDPGSFGQQFFKAVDDGYVLSFICPDWRTRLLEMNLPGLSGKMALMPMPAFEPGGRRTSTWGGTMLGITRQCRQPELAWDLARQMYFDVEALGRLFRETNILPPYKDAWKEPAFDEVRPYWSGQRLGREYIQLAEQVPVQHGGPFLEMAKGKMGEVISACTAYYRSHGEAGFEAFTRRRLKDAADYVRLQMERNPF